MNTSATVLVAMAILLVRQLFVLAAIIRSRRFLTRPTPTAAAPGNSPVFVVVVPVLRETAIITEAVEHFQTIAHPYTAHLVIVTTAREDAEPVPGGRTTTAAKVSELAAAGKVVHLHYPDPAGLKADQLNHAAAYCAATLHPHVPAEQVFLVCYDADSRPPAGSLLAFADAIAAHPEADVYHQSSSFEFRRRSGARPRQWQAPVCDAGALRANRFVLGFELPRLLNRSVATAAWKRRACSYVYAHVTGHGLCIRLSAMLALPLPARSPLEDMHYSFILCSQGLPMIAAPTLDRAEVPDSPGAQVEQAARWFFGPGRALQYLHDPATRTGPRSYALAASALGSATEWIGCAVVPPLLLAAAWFTYPTGLLLAAAIAAVYAAQLLLTETYLGGHDPLWRRITRVVACPAAATLHGLGGMLGAIRLARGGSGVGKTERR